MTEIDNIINQYIQEFQLTTNQYNSLVQRISRMRWPQYYKNHYINHYKNQYNTNIVNLKSKRDNRINNYIENIVDDKLKQKIADLNVNQQQNLNVSIEENKSTALAVGINYTNSEHELRGCINDANSITRYLSMKHKLNESSISILTDYSEMKPTRNNILQEFKKLLENSKSGDTLYFTYSGHGSYTRDYNNDEADGKDELLVSQDLQGIKDDELKYLLEQHLNEGVTIFILFDCCHSGTLMDLKYNYLSKTDYNDIVINEKSKESKGNVYLISGCKDEQTSADAFINNKFQGAMTWAFLKTVNENKDISWKDLLLKMRELLKEGFTQIPQLSAGKNIDINSKIFM